MLRPHRPEDEKLTHENIGQMDMYVRMFDDLKRGTDDNPTLGIILCESQQLFASKYRLILPSEEELAAELDRRHIFELPAEGGGDE